MPRPRSLTPADVAAAALAVLDREGLAGFTMRAVAAELHMATMSIYNYVRSREELEELVIEALLSEVDLTLPRRATWRRQVSILVERVRDVAQAHPQVVPLALPHRLTSAAGLLLSETFLGALARAGFGGQQRERANRILMSYLLGSLQFEHSGQLSAMGSATVARLSGEYPLVADGAQMARRALPDEEFRIGLAIVLDGLQASLARPPATECPEGS
jgi:AcrR family transcriptional regulator